MKKIEIKVGESFEVVVVSDDNRTVAVHTLRPIVTEFYTDGRPAKIHYDIKFTTKEEIGLTTPEK